MDQNYPASTLNLPSLDQMRPSFWALATISNICKLLPDAIISLLMTSLPLQLKLWAERLIKQAFKTLHPPCRMGIHILLYYVFKSRALLIHLSL
jgi:hypothetical protein